MKRGNILVNALFTLSLSSIVLLSITRANYNMHNVQQKTYRRDVEVTFIDVTFDNFIELAKDEIEEADGQFFSYDGQEFANWLDNWFSDIDQCSSGPHDTSTNFDWWIIFWGGGQDTGVHTYTATCTTPTDTIDYVLEVEYTTDFEYDPPFPGSSWDWLSCLFGNQGACDRWEDEDNWTIAYSAEVINSYFE